MPDPEAYLIRDDEDAAKQEYRVGCCSSCDGTGVSYEPGTNGRCWDCFGTGHPHIGPRDLGRKDDTCV